MASKKTSAAVFKYLQYTNTAITVRKANVPKGQVVIRMHPDTAAEIDRMDSVPQSTVDLAQELILINKRTVEKINAQRGCGARAASGEGGGKGENGGPVSD